MQSNLLRFSLITVDQFCFTDERCSECPRLDRGDRSESRRSGAFAAVAIGTSFANETDIDVIREN